VRKWLSYYKRLFSVPLRTRQRLNPKQRILVVWNEMPPSLCVLFYDSVSQPVVRGPPVVRYDGTGGPQADLN
jgi:hypothetical protein